MEDLPTQDVSLEPSTEQAPEAPVSQKHKVTVDGQEQEVSLDDLIKGYGLEKASQKRFQESASLRKQADEIIGGLTKDTRATLAKAGIDPIKFAEQILLEKLEWESLPEHDKKLKLAQQDKEKTAAELKKYKDAEDAKRREYEEQEAASAIDTEIGDALKGSGLTPSARIIARVAEYMLAGSSAKHAVASTRNDFSTDINDLLGQVDEATLLSLIPKDVLAKLRRADTRQTKQLAKPATQAQASQPADKRKTNNLEDFFKSLPSSD